LRSAATDVDPPTGRVSVYVSGRRRAPSTAHWFHGGKPVERKEQATHPHGALGTTWQRPICTWLKPRIRPPLGDILARSVPKPSSPWVAGSQRVSKDPFLFPW